MGTQFERPLLLLLLLPPSVVPVYLLWRTSRVYLPPVRRVAALVPRTGIVSLLVLALAGPMSQLSAHELALAVLFDRSDSITPVADQEQWLTRALAAKGADDEMAVVTFAGEAHVERPLSAGSSPLPLANADGLQPAGADIAAAIRMGLGALPAGMARRFVLLSDGQENQEQADEAAGLAAAAVVQLFVVPLEQSRGPEALVDSLDDLIAIDGDPSVRIGDLRSARLVMKGGQTVANRQLVVGSRRARPG